MPQINLLKQTKNTESIHTKIPSLLVKVFGVVLLAAAVYYGWLFTKIRATKNSILSLENQIAQGKATVVSLSRKDELFTRQAQLKEASALIQKHPYWSSLLPEIAKVSYKIGKYRSLSVLSDGSLTIQVGVPTYKDLDKLLQAFDDPELSEHFSNVKIASMSQAQTAGAPGSGESTGASLEVVASLQMDYDTGVLNYNFGDNNKSQ